MKENKSKLFWKGPWAILSFPKLGCSLVYDTIKKKYEIYKGLPHEEEDCQVISKGKSNKQEDNIPRGWYSISLVLIGALIASIVFLIMVLAFR